MKLKYDYYESFVDGSGEHKMTKEQINRIFTEEDLQAMKDGDEIIKNDVMKYWFEEAMNY